MGVSVSTATAVIGLALLLILQGLTTTFLFSVEEFRDSLQSYNDRVVEHLQTDLTVTNVSDTGWWDASWQNRKMVIINHSKVSDQLHNFPVLLNITDEDLRDKAEADGGDIIFVSHDNSTQYYHEIESYNSTNGHLIAWVNVTTVLDDENTWFFMYYNNPMAMPIDTTKVWDNYFRMVHHFTEDSGIHADSTSYDNDGTPLAGVNQSVDGLPQLNGADEFDGIDDYVTCGNDSSLQLTNGVTIEAWVKDPPRSFYSKELQILDKRDEKISCKKGDRIQITRQISADKHEKLIFSTLGFTDCEIEDISIGSKTKAITAYKAGFPQNKRQNDIESVRKQLPLQVRELPQVSYTEPFSITEDCQVQITVRIKSDADNLRLSYLIQNLDGTFDVECTTHFTEEKKDINWFNPLSVIEFVVSTIFSPEFIDQSTDGKYHTDHREIINKIIEDEEQARVIIDVNPSEQDPQRLTEKMKDLGIDITTASDKHHYLGCTLNQEQMNQLLNEETINGFYIDKQFEVFIQDSLPRVQWNQTVEQFNVTGKQVKIAFLDTGVNSSVVNYSIGYDFVNDDEDPEDNHGHGTQIAEVLHTIAPDAELIVAKVINNQGIGYESNILRGLEYCIEQQPDIICFSIGSQASCSGFCDVDFVAQMCNEAVDSGIFVVAAAGNKGLMELVSPACGSKVFSVGATTNEDTVTSFSNVHPTLDLFAPGENISTSSGGGSGTSYSAIFVAGAAALLLEKNTFSPVQLKYRLRSTGYPLFYTFNETLTIPICRLDMMNALLDNQTCIPYNYSDWTQSSFPEGQLYEPLALHLETITFYYDSYDNLETWSTNPQNMVNGLLGSYASTSMNQDVQLLTEHTFRQSDAIGTIKYIKLRAYAYYSGLGTGDIILRPVFSGNIDGLNYQFTTYGLSSWSPYQDITNDSKAPKSWTWGDVEALDCDVQSSLLGRTVYCSRVEIQVTYDTNDPPVLSNPIPSNNSQYVPLNTSELNITLADPEGDPMGYSIETVPEIGGVNRILGGGYYNGSVNCSISGIQPWTTYIWFVNCTDYDGSWTNRSYTFRTTSIEPAVTTNVTTGVKNTNATLQGYLLDNQSVDATCGFWYDTTPSGISNNQSLGVIGEGNTFSYNAQGLTPGQLYFVKTWENSSNGFNSSANQRAFLTHPNQPNSINVQANTTSMIYLNWTIGVGSNTTYIERNATDVTSWSRGEGIEVYNGTGDHYEDSGLSDNTTYYYQLWGYSTWTYNPTLEQWSSGNGSARASTDFESPSIQFIEPTLNTSTHTNNTFLEVNISSSDPNRHYTIVDLNESLVLWLRMDDINATGDITDLSTYQNNASVSGNAEQTSNGFFGDAFTFDGSSGTARCGDPADGCLDFGTGDFTLICWVKTSESNDRYIISKHHPGISPYRGYGLAIESGKLVPIMDDGGVTSNTLNGSTSSINDGEWHQCVAVFDRDDTCKVYIDGSIENETDISSETDSISSTYQFRLAVKRSTFPPHEYFNGTIDEILVFNRALNHEEINATYNASASQYYNNFTSLTDGLYNYTGYAVDIAGNKNESETRNATIDTIKPEISFTSPQTLHNDTHTNNTYLTINISTTDNNQHYTFADINESLMLWLRMDDISISEVTTTLYDQSSQNNHATSEGDPNQTDNGMYGKAFSFDGIGDYIDVPEQASVTNNDAYTISLWFKTTTPGSGYALYHEQSGGDYVVIAQDNTNLAVYDDTDDLSMSVNVNVNDGNWHHACLVKRSPSDYELYHNSVSIDTDTDGGTFATTPDTVNIGYGVDWLDNFSGLIDEVLTFNRALTHEEIKSLYNASTYQYNANNTSLSDDSYNITGYTVDRAGNKNQTNLRNNTIDTIKPMILFDYPPTLDNDTYTNHPYLTINLTTTDVNTHYSFLDFNESLVGWWRMDDVNSSGEGATVYDLSQNNNDGTAQNNANQTENGFYGKGFYFDGTEDRILLPDIVKGCSELTISVWVKMENQYPTGLFYILEQIGAGDDSFYLARVNTLYLFAVYNDAQTASSATSTSGYPDTNWHHIVGTYNGTKVNLYVDGVIADPTPGDLTGVIETNPGSNLYVSTDDAGSYWHGTIDEVLIFNRSLSTSEVLSLYNASANQFSNNFTDLNDDTYNFTGYSVDRAGNKNETLRRTNLIDTVDPTIEFVAPTKQNGIQNYSYIHVNVTSTDDNQHYTFTDLKNDVLLWLRMDDVSSTGEGATVYDLSSYENDGRAQNNANQTDNGFFGKAFSFDGDDDAIELNIDQSIAFNKTRSYSWSLWLYYNSSGGEALISNADNNAGYIIFLQTNNSIGLLDGITETGWSNRTLTTETWNHVVVTYSNDSFNYYINAESSGSGSGSFDTYSTEMRIGDYDTSLEFDGLIDEVVMFNRTLTVNEVQSLYDASVNQYERNFTGLSGGNYTFQSFSVDRAGNRNQTDERYRNLLYVENVTITAAHNWTLDDLIGSGDYDGGGESSSKYEWYTNETGTWQPLGINATTLDSNYTNETSWYKFEYTPGDGGTYGDPVNSTAFQVIPLEESAGVYTGVYSEKGNMTIVSGGTVEIRGECEIIQNVTVETGGALTLGNPIGGGIDVFNFGSFALYAGGSYTGQDETLNITSVDSTGFATNFDGTVSCQSGSLISFQCSQNVKVDLEPSSGNLYNVEIDMDATANEVINDKSSTIGLNGYLHIKKGTFNTSNGRVETGGRLEIDFQGVFDGEGDTVNHIINALIVSEGVGYGVLKGSKTSTITVNGEYNDYAVDIDGSIEANNCTLYITTEADTNLDLTAAASNNFHHVTLSMDEGGGGGEYVATVQNGETTITGNLNITEGELDTNDNPLVIGGNIEISDGGTLNVYGDTSGPHNCNSLIIHSGGTYRASGRANMEVTGKYNDYALDIDGTWLSDGDAIELLLDLDDTAYLDATTSLASDPLCSIIIKQTGVGEPPEGAGYRISNPLSLSGSLHIQNGRLYADNYRITTDEQLLIDSTGIFKGDGARVNHTFKSISSSGEFYASDQSIIYITGETSDYAVDLDGSYYYDTDKQTIQINTTTSTNLDLQPVTGNIGSVTLNGQLISTVSLMEDSTLDGNLTIAEGVLSTNSRILTVNKSVIIEDQGVLTNLADAFARVHTLGSLSIESGGTFTGGQQSTVILNKVGPSEYTLDVDGTITANSNTFNIQVDEETFIDVAAGSGNLHDLTIFGSGVVQNTDAAMITGDLYVQQGTFVIQNAGDFEVSNITIDSGNELQIEGGAVLTMNGELIQNGTFEITEGHAYNINLSSTIFNLTNAQGIYLHDIPNKPPNPSGLPVWQNISKYVNISATPGIGTKTVDINITYKDSDLGDIYEQTLTMYKYNVTTGEWTSLDNSQLNMDTNNIWVPEITNFSIFSPLGETNLAPILSNEDPENESVDVPLNPMLGIQANDSDADQMNLTWYWGLDESTPNYIGENLTIVNGTFHMDNDNNFSSNGVTYYWRVVVNDGHGHWTNETYHFTVIGVNKEVISKLRDDYALEINQGATTLYGYIETDNIVQADIDVLWHHVALTFNGTMVILYVDGKIMDTTAWVGSISANNNNITLGKRLTGLLDEVRVSSVARSSSWLNTSFNSMNQPNQFLYVEDEQTYAYSYLNISIENTGLMDLNTDLFNLLVNGENSTFISMRVYLFIDDHCTLVTNVTRTGRKRIKIITDNGISEYSSFEYS